jgi:hypothetical protein
MCLKGQTSREEGVQLSYKLYQCGTNLEASKDRFIKHLMVDSIY